MVHWGSGASRERRIGRSPRGCTSTPIGEVTMAHPNLTVAQQQQQTTTTTKTTTTTHYGEESMIDSTLFLGFGRHWI